MRSGQERLGPNITSLMQVSGFSETGSDKEIPDSTEQSGRKLLVMDAMGLLYEFFAAEDDEAAAVILTAVWQPPTFCDEGILPQALADLEALLTGRSSQEVAADPRHGTQIAEKVDEDAGVAECGVVGVTDTVTRALAAADATILAAVAAAWQSSEVTVRGLATVARHAAAHGHRMYCFWSC